MVYRRKYDSDYKMMVFVVVVDAEGRDGGYGFKMKIMNGESLWNMMMVKWSLWLVFKGGGLCGLWCCLFEGYEGKMWVVFQCMSRMEEVEGGGYSVSFPSFADGLVLREDVQKMKKPLSKKSESVPMSLKKQKEKDF